METEKNGSGSIRKYELFGLALIAIALVSVCGLSGLNVGFVGLYFAKFLRYLFGIGAWVTALVILLIGLQYIIKHRGVTFSTRFGGIALLYISCLAVYHHLMIPPGQEILPASLPAGGGLLGGGFLFVIRKFFGIDGGIVILGAGIIGSILLATTWSLASGMRKTKQGAETSLYLAKDTLETTYGKVVQAETKVKEKVKGSFYNQEKDSRFADDETAAEKALPVNADETALATEETVAVPIPLDTSPTPAFTIEYSEDKSAPPDQTLETVARAADEQPPHEKKAPAAPAQAVGRRWR